MLNSETTAPKGVDTLYFTIWRWHFYAGLYVIPFLIMLSVTGILMVWFTAVAPEYGERLLVAPQTSLLSVADQAAAALARHPDGKIGQYIAPYAPNTPAMFRIDLEGGAQMVALNPYSGEVLQDSVNGKTWNAWISDLHGELLIGMVGDRMVEIAASLALMLVVTGLYLNWPRNGAGWRSMVLLDLTEKGRAWWKSLHSVTGFWGSVVLVLFLISGLAWSGVWGEKLVQAWSTFPAEKWDNVPLSDETHASMDMTAAKTVPWALEQTLMPKSGSAVGVAGVPDGVAVGLQSIAALGRTLGLKGRFQVAAPADTAGVWTISQDSMSYDSANPIADRTVHVDQYTGKILASVGFADYSLAGKSMAVGIALHEGQLGLWNVVLNVGFCLLVIFICVSGTILWWKRRPAAAGRLAAPPKPVAMPTRHGVIAITAALSVAFPMLGATLLAVFAFDFIVARCLPGLKRVLS